jgi:hypothetical protein
LRPRSPLGGLDFTRQWEKRAAIEPSQLIARKGHLAHDKAGAMKAHGSGFFKSEANGLGGGPEAARPRRQCGLPAAAKIKLGASLEVWICHFSLYDPALGTDILLMADTGPYGQYAPDAAPLTRRRLYT